MDDSALLNDDETNEVLDAVENEYKVKEVDDNEFDELLNQIHDAEDVKAAEKEDDNKHKNNKKHDNNMCNIKNPTINEFTRRCDDILQNKERLREYMDALYFYCGLKGNTSQNKENGSYDHLPVSLFPHIVSLNEWLDLRRCNLIFHKLIDAISRDSNFLLSRMKCIAEADPNYTGKFYKIYEKQIKEKQFNKKWIFNSLRMDYMRNGNKNGIWSQIEAQFSPGGTGWISVSNQLHQFLVNRFIMDRELKIYDTKNNKENNFDKDNLFLTPNKTYNVLSHGIAIAAKLIHSQNPTVLIIYDSSRQDCNWIALKLWENHQIKTIFRTYAEVGIHGKIDENTKDLIIDNKYIISFVYCRGGSKRTEWNDKNGMDWKGRELIEFSSAISDCSIAYTLINTKFMQTIYSQKDVLLKYLDEEEASILYKHFVCNYNFDERFTSKKEINRILNDVVDNYDNYVMKPSGDGGGHCIFGKDIVDLINKLSNDNNNNNNDNDIKLGGWILMEKIKNVEYTTGHIRNNKLDFCLSVQEIGIYSQYLCDAKTGKLVIIDECIGDVIKTRKAQFDEAGIGAGFGVVDSIILDSSK